MNRLVLLATIAGALLVTASPALPGGEKNLGCGDGRLVVDVHYQVTGDLDTTVPIGSAQYDWALDTYVRHVRVWQTAPGRFCAATTSRGTFTTLAGHSPGGTGTLTAGIKGFFEGSYRTNDWHGTLLAAPRSPARGDLGTKDFACQPTAGHAVDSSGANCRPFDWFSQYFTSSSGADWKLVRYAFTYHAGRNGTWIDMQSGGKIRTHGDIVAK